jgi:hypothetical protein
MRLRGFAHAPVLRWAPSSSAPGAMTESDTKEERVMRCTPRPPVLRLIALAALAVALLVSSCTSTGVRTAEEVKEWERCDGSWPQNLTYVCFRR